MPPAGHVHRGASPKRPRSDHERGRLAAISQPPGEADRSPSGRGQVERRRSRAAAGAAHAARWRYGLLKTFDNRKARMVLRAFFISERARNSEEPPFNCRNENAIGLRYLMLANSKTTASDNGRSNVDENLLGVASDRASAYDVVSKPGRQAIVPGMPRRPQLHRRVS
jgi:hypothetical protein